MCVGGEWGDTLFLFFLLLIPSLYPAPWNTVATILNHGVEAPKIEKQDRRHLHLWYLMTSNEVPKQPQNTNYTFMFHVTGKQTSVLCNQLLFWVSVIADEPNPNDWVQQVMYNFNWFFNYFVNIYSPRLVYWLELLEARVKTITCVKGPWSGPQNWRRPKSYSPHLQGCSQPGTGTHLDSFSPQFGSNFIFLLVLFCYCRLALCSEREWY